MPRTINEDDTMLVKNIDTDCHEVSWDVEQRPQTVRDEMGQPLYTNYEKVPVKFNHEDGFRVKYAGRYHTIKPGATRRMPRSLAEHWGKHLVDHLLVKQEAAYRKEHNLGPGSAGPGLLTNQMKRDELMNKIILGVVDYYLEESQDEGSELFERVERINTNEESEERYLELDKVEEKHYGEHLLEDIKEEEVAVDKPVKKASLSDPGNLPSIKELRQACQEMGIETTGRENQEELASKLKAFA